MHSRSNHAACCAVLLAAAFLGLSGTSHAGDKALAEALYRAGKDLMDAGKLDEACPKLQASMKEAPAAVTQLNLALCHEKQGKTATAWAEYNEAAALAKKNGESNRAEVAKEFAGKLEPNLSRLTITVTHPVDDLEVRRNGEPIVAAALGLPVPVDPGQHNLEAAAPGYETWRQTVDVAAGGANIEIAIPALDAAVTERVPTGPASATPPSETPPPEPPDEGGSGLTTAGIVLMVGGGVGLGIGAIFGVLASSKKFEATDDPTLCADDKGCNEQGLTIIEDAKPLAHVSTAGFVIGGVALATGVTLLIVGMSDDEATGDSAFVPACGPDGCTMVWRGAF